jgi:four helix bundle protein
LKVANVHFKFEDLLVYQKAVEFAKAIYMTTENYPKQEMFGLTSQLRRAAVSIAANIAEGSSRTKKEFCHFLDVAQGSVYECVCLLDISSSRKFCSEQYYVNGRMQLAEMSRMLSGLKSAIQAPRKRSV